MSELMCRCGHERSRHRNGVRLKCQTWISTGYGFLDGHHCDCTGYDASRLPEPGQRLQFGMHRLNPPDAEAAPAWPSLNVIEGRNVARFRREQRKAKA